MTEDDLDRFYDTIGDTFIRLRGRGAMVTPKDYRTMQGWRMDGIRLGLILETMQEVSGRLEGPERRKLRSLRYFEPAVREAWRRERELLGPGYRPSS